MVDGAQECEAGDPVAMEVDKAAETELAARGLPLRLRLLKTAPELEPFKLA